MKFSTKNLIKNLKLISIGDFVYLDVPNNLIYFADEKSAVRVRVSFEGVTDEKIFVISRNDFIHIISFAEEVELKSNYTYFAGSAKGKFEHNSNFDSVMDSIAVHFDQSSSYDTICTVNSSILRSIQRASIFVSDNSNKEMEKYLNIKDNFIFSSSNFRIYKNNFSLFNGDFLFSSEMLKFIQIMGENTQIKKNENSFFLEKDDLSVYLTSKNRIDFLPLLEDRISNEINKVFATNKIEINTKEFLKVLNFINFYSKNHPSNLAYLDISDNKLVISTVTNNSISMDITNIEEIETVEENDKIAFNSINVQNIISKLGAEQETITLYISRSNSIKLFILQFSENEIVILTKINV